MKSRLLSIILLLVSFGASAQVDSVLSDFNASINVFYATGSAPTFRIQALINNTTGRYSSTDVEVGDIIYLNEADRCVRFRVDVVSAVGSAIQATVTDVEGVVSGFPLGIGFITRETANYSFPLHVDGVSSDLLSCARTHFTLLVDRITGGGADTDSIYYTLNGDLVLVTRKDTIPLPSVIDTTFASNDTLYIVSGGDTTFAIISTTDTDKQNLSLIGDSLLIERGTGVDLSVYRDTFTGAGADTDSIYFDNRDSIRLILRGDTISLPPDLVYDGDSSITNELQDIDSVVLSGNLLTVYISNGASASVDLSGITLTDRADTSGYNLTFYIQNDSLNLTDGIGNLRVDLSPYLDNTDTSGYNQTLSLSNDTLYLTDGASTLQVYIPSAIDTSFSSGDTLFIVSNGDTNAIVLSVPGDNWGSQVVVSDATLDGDGRSVNPLKIAQQGATSGQVLKWNGSTWQPADDIDTDTDTDTDGQNLSIVGDSLLIERGSGVDLSVYLDNTDTDSIVVDSLGTLLVKNRGDVITLIPDTDTDTDEQNLSLVGDSLLIERGTGVDLSPYLDNTDTDSILVDSLGTLLVKQRADIIYLIPDTDTDEQNLSLVGDSLLIDSGTGVDLSIYLDNTDTDTIIIDSAGVKTYTVTRNDTIYIPAGDGTGTDTSGYNQSFTKVGDSLILVDGATRFAVYDPDSAGGGGFVLPTDSITFNNNEAGPDSAELNWDATLGYLVFGGVGNQLIQIGQDQYWMTINQSGGPILKGEVVKAVGATGNSGKFLIEKFQADGNTDVNYLLGVAAHDIPNGSEGYVMHQGKIRQIDLTAYGTGQVLYVSPTVAGDWVTTEPANGYQKLPIAFVVDSSANGTLAVRVKTGESLRDLHDVDVSSPADGDLIAYDSVLGYWVTKADSVIDDDADSTNELQTLSISSINDSQGNKIYTLNLSNGNQITFTDNITDGDFNSLNEIQTISIDSTPSRIFTIELDRNNSSVNFQDQVDDADNDPTNELDNTDSQQLGWTQSTGEITLDSSASIVIDTFNGVTRGLVPDAYDGRQSADYFLSMDGKWKPTVEFDNQTISYVPETGVLVIDGGNQDTIPVFDGTTRGLVPDSDGNSGKFLSGDGTFQIPPDSNTQLSNEQVQDIVGGMVTGNTETGITVEYQDADGTIDFVATDQSATNELQTLTWSAGTNGNDEITLSNGGLTVTITDDVDDADASPTNEAWFLKADSFVGPSTPLISNDMVIIKGEGGIYTKTELIDTLVTGNNIYRLSIVNTDTSELQTLSWSVGTNGNDEITLSGGGNTITITDDKGTDNQEIAKFELTGTDLKLAIESDGQPDQIVSFAGWDTDEADDFSGSWNNLSDIPAGFADNVDNVNDNDSDPSNEITTIVTSAGSDTDAGTLTFSATDFVGNQADDPTIRLVPRFAFTPPAVGDQVGSSASNKIPIILYNDRGIITNASEYDDPDPSATNEIQSLTWSSGTNGNDQITLSNGGGTVTITDNTGTDDQQIEKFQLTGTDLTLAIEDDGQLDQTVSFTGWDTNASDDGTVTSVGGTGSVNGVTLTGTVTTTGNLTLGGTLGISNDDWTIGGADLSLTNGGTGSSLSDPNDDRLMYWDDGLNLTQWLDLGVGLNISSNMYVDSRNMTEAPTLSSNDFIVIDDLSASSTISTRKVSPSNINLSAFNNDVPFLTTEVDGSTTNEIQNLTWNQSTGTLALSNSSPASIEIAQYSGAERGLVPDVYGVGGSTRFLRSDGTWQIPLDDQNLSLANVSAGVYKIDIEDGNDVTIDSDNGITLTSPVSNNLKISGPGQGNGIGIYVNDLFVDSENLTEAGTLGSGDFFVIDDASVGGASLSTRKISPANLRLSLMNNDAGFITTETDDQQISEFAIASNNLNLTLEGDATGQKTVNLSPYLDNTDSQGFTGSDNGTTFTFDLSGTANDISLTEGSNVTMTRSGTNVTINAIGFGTGTDDQTIDVFSLAGNVLSLSLESDGEATKTVTFTNWDTDVTDDLTMLNGSNNRLVTSNTTSQLNAEADLTFDGTTLEMRRRLTAGGLQMVYNPDAVNTALDASMVFGNGGGSLTSSSGAQGQGNTLVGFNAGLVATTAYHNTIVGAYAGDAITSGFRNTAIGYQAGRQITTGQENTLLGFRAGQAITTAHYNTMFGTVAGELTTGTRNNYIGHESGRNLVDDDDNTFQGYRSGFSLTSGSDNVIIGSSAATINTIGEPLLSANGSIYLGANTRGSNTGGNDNEIVIGQGAIGEGSNSTVIGNGNITSTKINGNVNLVDVNEDSDVSNTQILSRTTGGVVEYIPIQKISNPDIASASPGSTIDLSSYAGGYKVIDCASTNQTLTISNVLDGATYTFILKNTTGITITFDISGTTETWYYDDAMTTITSRQYSPSGSGLMVTFVKDGTSVYSNIATP